MSVKCTCAYQEVTNISFFGKFCARIKWMIPNQDYFIDTCDSRIKQKCLNHLSANRAKWSNTLKQFVGCCRQFVWVCLVIYVRLAPKGLNLLCQGSKNSVHNALKVQRIVSIYAYNFSSVCLFLLPCSVSFFCGKWQQESKLGNIRIMCEICSNLTIKIP